MASTNPYPVPGHALPPRTTGPRLPPIINLKQQSSSESPPIEEQSISDLPYIKNPQFNHVFSPPIPPQNKNIKFPPKLPPIPPMGKKPYGGKMSRRIRRSKKRTMKSRNRRRHKRRTRSSRR